MNKNTTCKHCGKHFREGVGIYVIKPDNDDEDTYHLCTTCFNIEYNGNPEFKEWYDNDTKVLDMDEDELYDEFGYDSSEALDYCSYFTEFQDEDDDEE